MGGGAGSVAARAVADGGKVRERVPSLGGQGSSAQVPGSAAAATASQGQGAAPAQASR